MATVTLDSNILVYAADRTAGTRHETALVLVDRARQADCVQPLQTFAEFYAVVTRKGHLAADEARSLVDDWTQIVRLTEMSLTGLHEAMGAAEEHRIHFWDAMLWATAKQAGCRILFTEDFQDGRTLEGVTFVNPFLPENARYVDLALPPA
jgi:predicted nucleic acid-binding protein